MSKSHKASLVFILEAVGNQKGFWARNWQSLFWALEMERARDRVPGQWWWCSEWLKGKGHRDGWTRETEDSKLARDGLARTNQMSFSSMREPRTQACQLYLPTSSALEVVRPILTTDSLKNVLRPLKVPRSGWMPRRSLNSQQLWAEGNQGDKSAGDRERRTAFPTHRVFSDQRICNLVCTPLCLMPPCAFNLSHAVYTLWVCTRYTCRPTCMWPSTWASLGDPCTPIPAGTQEVSNLYWVV